MLVVIVCDSGESMAAGSTIESSDLQELTCCSSSLMVPSSCALSRRCDSNESTAAVSGIKLSDLLEWICSLSVDWFIGLVQWTGASRECVM